MFENLSEEIRRQRFSVACVATARKRGFHQKRVLRLRLGSLTARGRQDARALRRPLSLLAQIEAHREIAGIAAILGQSRDDPATAKPATPLLTLRAG
jgi:hypothetical protein